MENLYEYAWRSRPFKSRQLEEKRKRQGKGKGKARKRQGKGQRKIQKDRAEHSLAKNKHKILNTGEKRLCLVDPRKERQEG